MYHHNIKEIIKNFYIAWGWKNVTDIDIKKIKEIQEGVFHLKKYAVITNGINSNVYFEEYLFIRDNFCSFIYGSENQDHIFSFDTINYFKIQK